MSPDDISEAARERILFYFRSKDFGPGPWSEIAELEAAGLVERRGQDCSLTARGMRWCMEAVKGPWPVSAEPRLCYGCGQDWDETPYCTNCGHGYTVSLSRAIREREMRRWPPFSDELIEGVTGRWKERQPK